MDDVAPSTTRRGLLAATGVGATSALAGCWERLWSQAETSGPEQVSLTIKTVPTEDDEFATAITSHLRENYRAAGIDATRDIVTKADFYRDVLLEGNYDVFVAKYPGLDDPDALYGLLHSQFDTERGWQNPFHFTDLWVDNQLEEQRTTEGEDREAVLVELIEYLLETTPYTVVAHPHTVSGVHDGIEAPTAPRTPVEYFELMAANGPHDGPLDVGVFGEGLAENLNPIAVDRNRIEGLLDLVYDPLARRIDGDYVPWLAEDVEWEDDGGLRARVTLREGLEWHDGETLDAEDVAFTFEFIADTSMGTVDGGAATPRFRGRQTLVAGVDVDDSRTLTLLFRDSAQVAARRALTVPVLPEHVWADRSGNVTDRRTQALVDDNAEPVGSGLFAFDEATTGAEVRLEPFEDHVLRGADEPDLLEGVSRFEGLRFQIDPNPGAMVEALVDGETDVTGSQLPPDDVSSLRDDPDTAVTTGDTDAFYMIGYNRKHPQLGSPNFRRVCSRLIDREHVVTTLFDGLARVPTTHNEHVGIRDERWEYEDAFDEGDLLSFPGSDGELDVSQVRSLFRDINYGYNDSALLESQ